MKLAWEPVSDVHAARTIADILVVEAYLSGASREAEVSIDSDALTRSFLESDELPDDDRVAYKAEPMAALAEARRILAGDASELLRLDAEQLGDDFPFEIKGGPHLVLERKAQVSLVGLAYTWRASFSVVASGDLQLTEKRKLAFAKQSEKLFEAFATMALAGRGNGRVWYLGRHRSVEKLLRNLERLCSYLGSGELKKIARLRSYVKNSNDGGVDAVAVFAPEDRMESGSAALLLSATVQRGNRKDKVIGIKEKMRFKSLFDSPPLIAMHGVLAIPFEADSRDEDFCADSDSIYLDMDAIFRFMRKLPTDFETLAWGRPLALYVRRRFRDLVAEAA